MKGGTGLNERATTTAPAGDLRWERLGRCGCCGDDRARPRGSAQGHALVSCRRCGTLRFAAVAHPDDVYRDGYHDGTSDFGWNYAGSTQRAYDRALAGARLGWLESLSPRFPAGRSDHPPRILDVGGGVGDFAAVARDRGWDATLLEPVAHAAAIARSTGVPTIQAGVDHLAHVDRRFDVVSFVHSLEHFSEAATALAAAAAVVGPGGHVFVEVPNHGSLARRLQGDWWNGWQAGEHVYVFTRRTLRRVLERAGLEVVGLRTFVPGWDGLQPEGYAHMVGLHRALARAVAAKHRVVPRGRAPSSDAGSFDGSPQPIREMTGIRRALFARALPAIGRLEERTGLGTNVQAVARVPVGPGGHQQAGHEARP